MRFASLLRPQSVSFAAVALIMLGALSAAAEAQTAAGVSTNARPTVRITGAVDNAVMAQLPGTHPAVVARATIGVRVAANKPLSHLMLVLSPTDDQAYALRSLMDQQQDKTSANYHKWLTPDTFGQYFGVASADVAKISAWLQDQGFSVDSVAKGNRIITFSGTVGQVESAFHTQINGVTVDGEAHAANVTDIAVPQAFAGVVKGIASLNDFFPKSNVFNPHKGQLVTNIPAGNYITPDSTPLYTSASTGKFYVAPGDAAVIFNSTPLLNAGVDGTGITVAVLGRTDITLSDVQQFRSMFGLKKNDPTVTVLGTDPGINGDDLESYLDVEWAGGMAPGASVNFIDGGSDYYFSSGINVAGLYAVDNNVGDIITLSYGGCETSNGASGTAFWNTLWEQAAAQGQTVFVSSGDSSATGCQSSSATYGTAYGVNALGSSAYNVAVGGTMFVDFGPSQYWNTPNQSTPFTTATSYIPEAAWNEGALSTTYLNALSTATMTGSGIVGTGGGLSIYTGRPAWQTGSGISSTADATCSAGTCIAANSTVTGLHRMVPDISFIAASGHDATIFCGEGVCSDTGTGYGIGAIGGTSVATPVMASVMALIDQKNGGRQGNANFFFYPLANNDYVAGNCKAVNGTAANPTVTLPASTCNFHDIVAGSNVVKSSATDTTGLGFYAATGYDPASGLGSVNINNVATNWSTVTFRATTTTFTLSPTETTHGTAQILTATVASSSGTGTPTGDISLIAETTNPSDKLRFTLNTGAYGGSINGLPAGNYNVHVHYEGDGTFAASDSASIPVSITKESSTVTNTLHYLTAASQLYTGGTTVPYGTFLFINSKTAGTSSATDVPTGQITYALSLGATALTPLVQTLDGYGDTSFQEGGLSTPLYLAANYPALSPGAYTLTTSYSGDSTFGASSISGTLTITQGTPTLSLTSSATNIASAASVTLNYSVTRPTGTYVTPTEAVPTGSVTFTDTTSGTTLGTVALNAAGLATLTTTNITTAGANTITAVYAGDTNWATQTSTTTVTVGSYTPTTTALTIASGSYYVGTVTALTATVTPAVAGTVVFYDGGVRLGTAASSASTGIATFTSNGGLTAGAHSLSAVFSGTTTYAASTGTASLTVLQNVPSLTFDAPTTSTYGQAVVMNGRLTRSPSTATSTAVASPIIPPTGTVTFYDGSTAVATATPVFLPGGYNYYTATVSLSTLTAGTHNLSATYNGDANYATASSGTVTATVAQLTPTITLSSTATVYNGTTSVPLTATIPLPAALAAPTGMVTFYNGTTSLGSITATYSAAAGGYVASYTATSQASGPHVYKAVLTGDSNYVAATSNAFSVLVNNNNVWVANGNGTVSALTNTGSALTPVGVSGGGTAIAVDNAGDVWSLNKTGNKVSEFDNTGSLISSVGGGGVTAPSALAIDGSGLVWIANGNSTLSVLNATGTMISPSAGYKTSTSTPTSLTIDASGNLWITNAGDNSVTEVVGAATPVTTPTANAVKSNTLAAKP